MLNQHVKSLIAATAIAAAAACGNSGSRDIPAAPTAPDAGGASNSANITAPGIDSPADDAQLDTLRPTLRVTNATSSGSGSRTYEFQISDNSGFSLVAGQTAAVAFTQSGIPEGADGKTSVTPGTDLLPASRYYWRARAIQGISTGPWSNTGRFRTKVDSFKSGNQVFDILTNGRTVADLQNDIAFIGGSDASPGLKLNSTSAYLGYKISALTEGEVSAIVRRIKPGDSSFEGQTRLFQMLDGTGDANGNPFRVLVDKFRDSIGGTMRFEFRTPAAGSVLNSGNQNWVDGASYFLKVEWRAGTARLRVFNGENDAASVKLDLSTTYGAPYNPGNHTVVFGSLTGGTLRDVRISRVYIGPNPRPISLGSALQP